MGKYTTFLEEKSITLFNEDEYLEELKTVIGDFRSFDEALDSFILEHGYKGDIGNIDDKVAYISGKCKVAGVPVPRNLKKWYTEHKRMERNTAIPFHICFAFELSVEEVNDFLRRICLSRGFDCHSIEEVVYFYAFKNGLKYDVVQDILSKVPKEKADKLSYEDIVYTDLIVDEIDEIESEDELVRYGEDTLEENLDFIAKALGNKGDTSREVIRNYFLNDFMADHLKIYQKRPIYWMFDSGKANGFKALIYLHRYNADTVGTVRTEYLHKTQQSIETALKSSEYIAENATGSEKSKATKLITKYTKQLAEIKQYDEAMAHIANQRIELDLDDGVKVNYEKFQGVEVAQEGKKAQKIDLLTKIK